MYIKIREIEEIIIRDIEGLKHKNSVDHRWLDIARSDIEKGFMALRRALEDPLTNIKKNEMEKKA